MQCPHCPSQLAPILYEGVTIHACDSCGGEFIGDNDFDEVIRSCHDQLDADLQQLLAARTPRPGVPRDAARSLCCPKCGEPMSVVSYGGDSGIFVNRCESCAGRWLEHAELDRIQVLQDRWTTDVPHRLRDVGGRLEQTRRAAAEQVTGSFAGSRFAFINALINRFLDPVDRARGGQS